jgi:hypothetical protein
MIRIKFQDPTLRNTCIASTSEVRTKDVLILIVADN